MYEDSTNKFIDALMEANTFQETSAEYFYRLNFPHKHIQKHEIKDYDIYYMTCRIQNHLEKSHWW
jgi:hypothetical protein